MYQWSKIKDLGNDSKYNYDTILCSDTGNRAMTVASTFPSSKSLEILISDDYGNIKVDFKGTLNQNASQGGFTIPVMSGDGNVMGFVNNLSESTKFNLYRIDYKSKSVKAVNYANRTRWNGIASNYKGDKIILAEYDHSKGTRAYYLMQNKSLKDSTSTHAKFATKYMKSPYFPPNDVQKMKLTKSGNELYGFYQDSNKSTLIRQDIPKSDLKSGDKGKTKFSWHKSF